MLKTQDDGCLVGDMMSLPILNISKMLGTNNEMKIFHVATVANSLPQLRET